MAYIRPLKLEAQALSTQTDRASRRASSSQVEEAWPIGEVTFNGQRFQCSYCPSSLVETQACIRYPSCSFTSAFLGFIKG